MYLHAKLLFAHDPEEIRAGNSRSIVKDARTVVFRIANETGEMQSPTFSLALRRSFEEFHHSNQVEAENYDCRRAAASARHHSLDAKRRRIQPSAQALGKVESRSPERKY